MEPEGLASGSKEPVIELHPKPHKSSPYPRILFL
jgi:hypothetical protein